MLRSATATMSSRTVEPASPSSLNGSTLMVLRPSALDEAQSKSQIENKALPSNEPRPQRGIRQPATPYDRLALRISRHACAREDRVRWCRSAHPSKAVVHDQLARAETVPLPLPH